MVLPPSRGYRNVVDSRIGGVDVQPSSETLQRDEEYAAMAMELWEANKTGTYLLPLVTTVWGASASTNKNNNNNKALTQPTPTAAPSSHSAS